MEWLANVHANLHWVLELIVLAVAVTFGPIPWWIGLRRMRASWLAFLDPPPAPAATESEQPEIYQDPAGNWMRRSYDDRRRFKGYVPADPHIDLPEELRPKTAPPTVGGGAVSGSSRGRRTSN